MKIYTKTGDNGKTSLIGGKRVPKYHQRIETAGTIDELICFIGLLRDYLKNEDYKNILLKIQKHLFAVQTQVEVEPDAIKKLRYKKLPKISPADILFLEREIDKISEELPKLKNFIVPGGHPIISYCHIARTICRRAERNTAKLSYCEHIDKIYLQYLNRLSDYLFVLARKLSKDLKIHEIKMD